MVLAQLISNDSIQTSQLVERINCYITSPIVNACLIQQSAEECQRPETEVLRDDGRWMRLDEIKEGDRILAVNDNMISYFTPIQKISVYDINEDIYNFRSKHLSQSNTKGHRVPVFTDTNDLLISTAEDLYKARYSNNKLGYNMLGIAPNYINPIYPEPINVSNKTSEVWKYPKWFTLPHIVKLLIALQADGTIPRSKYVVNPETGLLSTDRISETHLSRRVTFGFSKQRKIDKLEKLLKLLKIKYYKREERLTENRKKKPRVKLQTVMSFTMPGDFKLSKVFYDYLDLSMFTVPTAREFIEEVIQWDGWDYGYDTVGYDTTIKENADFVCAIAVLAGYRTKVRVDKDPRSETYNDLYRVSIARTMPLMRRGTVTVEKEHYKGKVYCPTVYGGMYICRHDGKVSLTGNSVHSDSYSVMAEDICQDTDRIYNMWKYEPELALKNKAVADMYQLLYQGDDPTKEDLLLAFVANNCLENIVFVGGFAFFFSIENYFVGSAELISEISKDELKSHVPLFKNIFRSAVNESFNGVVPASVVKKAHEMIKTITEAEIRWTTYISKDIPLFTEHTIKVFVENQANQVCTNLGIPLLYKDYTGEDNPLYKLVEDHIKGGEVATKTLFFEGNVVDYAKASVKMDLDLSNLDDL